MVVTLHSVALLFQLVGACLVIREIRSAGLSFSRLRSQLGEAECLKEKQRADIRRAGGATCSPAPGHRVDAAPRIADMIGPGATLENQAVRDFVQSERPRSWIQKWLGVTLVIMGAVVAYAANVLGTV
ncbi:hypothetical protein ACTXJM_11245 [Corynebacterium variabile]|uniref:hypothetical protein n=1 Tax=Corynebacterium variabile TaxID=1727 RepID=UPI003BB517A8